MNCGALRPPPLIEGRSDADRWAKFSAIQNRLIGMKYADIVKAFGQGKTNNQHSYLEYEITESQRPAEPGRIASTIVSIDLSHNAAESFRVEAIRWGDDNNTQISSRR